MIDQFLEYELGLERRNTIRRQSDISQQERNCDTNTTTQIYYNMGFETEPEDCVDGSQEATDRESFGHIYGSQQISGTPPHTDNESRIALEPTNTRDPPTHLQHVNPNQTTNGGQRSRTIRRLTFSDRSAIYKNEATYSGYWRPDTKHNC